MSGANYSEKVAEKEARFLNSCQVINLPPALFPRSRYVILRQCKISGGAIDFDTKHPWEPMNGQVVVAMAIPISP